jgi:hypothetical protein
MKTKQNSVFIAFMVLCFLGSVGCIYILMVRPLKIVVEAQTTEGDTIEFFYRESEVNPPVAELIKRSKDGHHIVVVLLTKKQKILANYQYKYLLDRFELCDGKLPCNVISMEKELFEEKSKRRKDLPYQKGQIRI